MAFDALRGYTRQQAPSGNVPEQGAVQGGYALAQATEAEGAALRRVGGAVADLGHNLEAESLRQSAINQTLALADIDEKNRVFLSDMSQQHWVENHVGRWDQAVTEWDRQFGTLLKSHAKQLHPKDRAAWQATMKARAKQWQNPVIAKAADLRETYANEAIAQQYVNRYAAGDVTGAAQLAEQARTLFADDALWRARLQDANEQIVWKVASQGDIERARALVAELIPAQRRASLDDSLSKYGEYARDRLNEQRAQAREKVLENVDVSLRAGKADSALAALAAAPEASPEEIGGQRWEQVQQKWIDRALNSAKPAETSPAAFNEAAQAQLQAAAGETKPADARETAAGLRFDQQKLSPDDYAQIRSWQDVDPVTAKIMLGAIESVKKQVKVGLRHLGLFQADTDKTLAATTKFIAERAAQAKETGKPLDPAELDQAARQFAAAQGQQALKDFAASAPPKEQDIDISGVPAPQPKERREKGPGYFGPLPFHDGRTSTELSIGVEIDGQEIEIPSLVPTLTRPEIDHLLSGQKPTKAIVRKAVDHAQKRMAEGKDVFAQAGEQVSVPKPKAKSTYPQMRRDTPPELRDRIKRLLDAGADPEEVFNADEVKPYVLRSQ